MIILKLNHVMRPSLFFCLRTEGYMSFKIMSSLTVVDLFFQNPQIFFAVNYTVEFFFDSRGTSTLEKLEIE